MKVSIHDYESRLASALKTVRRADISSKNKELIIQFTDHCFVVGLSKARIIKYTYYLLKISMWLGKDFESASRPDIEALVSKIQASKYVDFSKMEHRLTIRKFYKWLKGTEDYPPEVKWVNTKCKRRGQVILPEDLLAQQDIKKLSDAAKSERDRAFINTLYETGARIEEILTARIRNLQFDEYGAKLRIDGKTGPRRIRIISSVPYLTEWLNKHPSKDDHNAFLWPGHCNRPLGYNGVRIMIQRLAARAGIKKRVNPHSFRHACATYLANHLTEAQMNEYFGWIRASKMAAVYVHLSGRDVDNALLKLHGIKVDENVKEEDILKPKQCVRCKTSNPASNRFCSLCGLPLDQQAATGIIQESMERKKADNFLDEMLKDPHFRRTFLSRAQKLSSNPAK